MDANGEGILDRAFRPVLSPLAEAMQHLEASAFAGPPPTIDGFKDVDAGHLVGTKYEQLELSQTIHSAFAARAARAGAVSGFDGMGGKANAGRMWTAAQAMLRELTAGPSAPYAGLQTGKGKERAWDEEEDDSQGAAAVGVSRLAGARRSSSSQTDRARRLLLPQIKLDDQYAADLEQAERLSLATAFGHSAVPKGGGAGDDDTDVIALSLQQSTTAAGPSGYKEEEEVVNVRLRASPISLPPRSTLTSRLPPGRRTLLTRPRLALRPLPHTSPRRSGPRRLPQPPKRTLRRPARPSAAHSSALLLLPPMSSPSPRHRRPRSARPTSRPRPRQFSSSLPTSRRTASARVRLAALPRWPCRRRPALDEPRGRLPRRRAAA